jgi:SAM-dependent methyltransferase
LAADSIQEWALERVIESLDRRAPILEIGCGAGDVVGELKRRGFDAQCADIGCWHEELEGIVHTAGADLSRRLPFEDGAFGAVIGFEVLEHVTNPFNAASELARVLEKEGSLYLTLPNFWNVRARWRFLMRGSVNRNRARDLAAQAQLREGRCPPHISTLPWPTLKYALASFGFRVEELVGYTRRPWRHLGGLPLAAAIWGLTRLTPGSRRERFELDETNRWSILYASRHVFVRAQKVGLW